MPSEYDTNMFSSINQYKNQLQCANLYDPVCIDISENLNDWSAVWGERKLNESTNLFDYILNINMMHIAPFVCSEMLFTNCSKLLKPNGILFTYGPFSLNGVLSPQSNVRFNESLKNQNQSWGIRDICDLKRFAITNSIELNEILDLPANNKLIIWKKKH